MKEKHLTEFVMYGAREVLESKAVHLEKQIIAIEKAVTENPGLAFDLAKAIVESTCKTILKDRGHPYDEDWDLPKLFRQTITCLRLVPDSFEGTNYVADSLRKTVGGLQTVIQGLCELRNTQGFASHGKDAYNIQLEDTQAALAARAADAIVNFLFRIHRHYSGTQPSRPLRYEDHPGFNDYVDQMNEPVSIFNFEYRPSEVLFLVDQQAYRELLATYNPEEEIEDEDLPSLRMEEETA